MKQRALGRGIAVIAFSVAGSLALASCTSTGRYNDYDASNDITKKDYESLLGRSAPPKQDRGEEPPIPDFQSVLAAPSAPELADTRRVSIAVTETTPVRDIIIELARKAQVDLEMDPRISGGIIMTATDRPFIEVIGRIAELAELRYRFDRNMLRVEIDDPYIEQYRMDILNVTRSGTSDASSSTDASSSASSIGSGGGGGGSNKSATSVTTATKSAFWENIGANLSQIINGIQSRRGHAQSTSAVQASFVPEQRRAAVPAATNAGGGTGSGGGGPANALNNAAAFSAAAGSLQSQIDTNVAADQEAAAPGQDGAQPALVAGQAGAPKLGEAAANAVALSQYSLNPEAGIITVFATQRQQKVVERYLRDVRNSITQQILIEAKVLEVALSDQYRAGVDWTAVFGPNNPAKQLTVNSNFTRNVVPPEFADPTVSAVWSNGGDLSLAVQLVNEFGTVRTLSSPRLTVLNNQVAQLKVAENQVFFELQVNISDSTATERGRITVESQIKTVPVGLIMSVQPAVDPISRRISLNLRPSITRIKGYINDPGVSVIVALGQQDNPNLPLVSSPVPIVEVREMDSMLNLESGETVVMGGLMQDNTQTTREGLPGVMDVPLVGQALSQNIRVNKVTELVIFIRATLANAKESVSEEDIRLYKTFGRDARPVAF